MLYKTENTVASGQNKNECSPNVQQTTAIVFHFVSIHHIYLFLDSVYTGGVSQSSYFLHNLEGNKSWQKMVLESVTLHQWTYRECPGYQAPIYTGILFIASYILKY